MIFYVKKEDLGCWSWIGGKSTNGYGHFSVGGKGSPGKIAHRVSFELFKHEIPKGMWVLHTCRSKCVNPEHLFLGDRTDNMKDAAKKKRICTIGWLEYHWPSFLVLNIAKVFLYYKTPSNFNKD